MSSISIPEVATFMIVLVGSLTVHEWGHATSAYLLGDDTASRMGRMTLNPVPHIDPIGTLLIPLMMAILPGAIPLFGWAKPVPVNSARFKRSVTLRQGEAITAVAGPGTNLVLAVLGSILFGVILGLKPGWLVSGETGAHTPLLLLLQTLMTLNVALAFFNLIPVPPLDGGWILQWILPPRFDFVVAWLARHGMLFLLAAIFGPGYLSGLVPMGLLHALPIAVAPSTVVRVAAAIVLGGVSWYLLGAVQAARAAGRPGSAISQQNALEWTLPLAVALITAQVSVGMIGVGIRTCFWVGQALAGLLSGLS